MRHNHFSPSRVVKNDMPAPGPIRPVRRAAAWANKNTRPSIDSHKTGQPQKLLKIAHERHQPVQVQPLTSMEMFHKSNYSLVGMMKLKKDQINQLNQQKQRNQAAGQEVSAMLTPIHTESQRTMHMSQISTPKLTPLRRRFDANGCQISRLNISDLEGKIKLIENQISQVVLQGAQRKLDKLEKSLDMTAKNFSPSPSELRLDEESLIGNGENENAQLDLEMNQLLDLTKFDEELDEIEKNIEPVGRQPQIRQEGQSLLRLQPMSLKDKQELEFKNYDICQAIRRLFQFVEVESNISMDQIESCTYKLVKQRINQLLNQQNLDNSDNNILIKKYPQRDSVKKRQVKAQTKLNAKRLSNINYESRPSIFTGNDESGDSPKSYKSPEFADGRKQDLVDKSQNSAVQLISNMKKELNHVVTRSQIKLCKRKQKFVR